jgi:hypothetical protein
MILVKSNPDLEARVETMSDAQMKQQMAKRLRIGSSAARTPMPVPSEIEIRPI